MLPRTNTQSCPDRASTFHPAPEEAGPDEAGGGQEWGGQAPKRGPLGVQLFSRTARPRDLPAHFGGRGRSLLTAGNEGDTRRGDDVGGRVLLASVGATPILLSVWAAGFCVNAHGGFSFRFENCEPKD